MQILYFPSSLQSCDFILHVATHNINLFLLLKVFLYVSKIDILTLKMPRKVTSVLQKKWGKKYFITYFFISRW